MHKKRRTHSKTLLSISIFLLTVLLAGGIYLLWCLGLAGDASAGSVSHGWLKNLQTEGTSPETGSVKLPDIKSSNAILLSLDNGAVLGGKNENDRIYPASLTKIMTALIAAEQIKDLDQTVTLNPDIFQPLYLMQASMAGFEPGETASCRDLMYGVLLPSGAECCEALCELISGSEASFVELMNQKAQTLGMKDTHFTNATGLHDENHYTTVRDLSLLLTEALKNDTFRTIFTTQRYSVRPTNRHPDGFTFYSTLFQDLDTPETGGGQILGGKTGFTDEAGLCLASLYTLDGKEYILITAGAPGTHATAPYHIEDAQKIYRQLGF